MNVTIAQSSLPDFPGLVSPLLPQSFAAPAAYGAAVAGVLAIIATAALLRRAVIPA